MSTQIEEDVDGGVGTSILTPRRTGRTTGPVLVGIQELATTATESARAPAVELEVLQGNVTEATAEVAAETEVFSASMTEVTEESIREPKTLAEPTQEAAHIATPKHAFGVDLGTTQATDTTTPTESKTTADPASSPAWGERTECLEKIPESPVILISSSRATTSSPTTGLVTTSVLSQPFPVLPLPQPSVH